MTEVSVVFPSGGKIDVQNRESVEADQELSWKVQSFNPNVKKVKITFEDTANKFFGASHESPERVLSYSGAPGQEFAMATIWSPFGVKSGCAIRDAFVSRFSFLFFRS